MSVTTLSSRRPVSGIDYSSDFSSVRTSTTLALLLETGPVGLGGWFDVNDIAGIDVTKGYALRLPPHSLVHSRHSSPSDVFVAVSVSPAGRRELVAHMIGCVNRIPLTARPYAGLKRDLITVPQHRAGIHALSQIGA